MCEVDCDIDIVPTGREISEIAISFPKFGLEENSRNADGVNAHKIIE